jgi:putative hemolysin
MKHEQLPNVQDERLRVRLASDASDVRAVQTLRYRIFWEEMGAAASTPNAQDKLDRDPFDEVCDHLMVEDLDGPEPIVVGTYRLIRETMAAARGGFYSNAEYDLDPLLRTCRSRGQEVLELGRSCVAPAYRNSATIQLLWRGIADYLAAHRIGLMIGCASFPGADADRHAEALSYLYHQHLAPTELRAQVRGDAGVQMAMRPIGGYDPRLAMRLLPPLIKAYLRVGANVGDGAWLDHEFNTTDVLVVMPVERISARYSTRFAAA